jgi:very-short-patch-repair endonuclease
VVCAGGALGEPVAHKPRIAASVWHLEAVRGRGDIEVARIAELQRGILARSQLVAAGLSPAAIKHRLRTGHLHVLYPGVYLLGRPRLEPLAAATAAVIYAGGQGVLSHHTAARMWSLFDGPESPVELSAVGTGMRSRRGLTVHRTRSLSQADVRLYMGLPVTSPARTLLDLAGILDMAELEAAYAMALRRKFVRLDEISAAIARAPRRMGIATLRALLDHGEQPTLTRSRYERKLRALIRAADLPQPLVNTKVEGHEVDFFWPQHRLVLEFDGFGTHGRRSSFETDRLRDQRLVAAGHRVLRITARQIDFTPHAVIARLAAALAVATAAVAVATAAVAVTTA